MSGELNIALSAETLDSGPPEEAATFGVFVIAANDRPLTAGVDTEAAELRHGPRVSGYPIAEWLAWNWWRLRWEGESPTAWRAAREWSFAHRMSAIGGGYAWPSVEIVSDGRQCFLSSEPTRDGAVLFRYIGADRRVLVSAEDFEAAIDKFLDSVKDRLDKGGLCDTNFHRLLSDLVTERADPALARFRRLEAQLGLDPDEIDADEIHRRLADAAALGEEAVGEVAADTASRGAGPERMMSAADFIAAAERSGFDADWRDAAAPGGTADLPRPGEAPAWRVGKDMARRVRDRAGLANGGPVSNARLAELAGTTEDAIARNRRCAAGMAFALRRRGAGGRLALRSKWATGRRFELARLVGDRLFASSTGGAAENLFPATRAYSYRQKAQRAFAAELLSPFDAVDDMLRGDDYSEDSQRRAARRFDVSEMTIQTALVNHRRLARDEAPDVMDLGPAARAAG